MVAPEPIPPRQRWIVLGAMVLAFVLLGLGIQALRHPSLLAAPPNAQASPSTTPTPTVKVVPSPLPIPDQARSEVWRSTQTGSGQFVAASTLRKPALKAPKVNPYSVELETSLTSLEVDDVARQIQATLDDVRGWGGFGKNSFELVAPKDAKLRIVVAAPETADQLCGVKKGKGLWNCRVKDTVVINSDRWQFMVPNYSNLAEYRAYAVNHEVGKWLGQRMAFCTKKGQPAPAMMNQNGELGGCKVNAWPMLAN